MGSDPQHVAYPGAEGSYTEEAAGRLYPSARQSAFTTFDLVAAALVAGEVDRGVLPIENSLAGLVPDTLAILEEGAVSVVAEVALHIPHCLVGVRGRDAGDVRVVHSHPMALAQCRSALNGRYERVAASTTSEAARTVAALGDLTVAAIASPLRPQTHGLAILADEISDHPENLTRFVSLARFTRLDHDAHTEWHTALRLITKHEPGALHSAIEPLRYHDVQMTSLHSRPIMGEPWRYQFYIDVVGHRSAAARAPRAQGRVRAQRRAARARLVSGQPRSAVSAVAAAAPSRLDRRGLGVLSFGHLSVDLAQGTVPALIPFLVRDRGYSYAAAGRPAAVLEHRLVVPAAAARRIRRSHPRRLDDAGGHVPGGHRVLRSRASSSRMPRPAACS